MHRTPNRGAFSFGRFCGACDKSVMRNGVLVKNIHILILSISLSVTAIADNTSVSVYPVAKSENGWFAYSTEKEFILNFSYGQCNSPPCYKAHLKNLNCKDPHLSDSPRYENDVCFSRYGLNQKDISKYDLQLIPDFKTGVFPIELKGQNYAINTELEQKVKRSIIGGDIISNSCSVWLKSSKNGRTLLAKYFLIRKNRQPNTENPLKLNLSGVIVKHLPYRGK